MAWCGAPQAEKASRGDQLSKYKIAFESVTLHVKYIQRSVAFYKDNFGMRILSFNKDKTVCRMESGSASGIHGWLELVSSVGGGNWLSSKDRVFGGLNMICKNIERTYKTLSRSVKFVNKLGHKEGCMGSASVTCLDPDGYPVRLSQSMSMAKPEDPDHTFIGPIQRVENRKEMTSFLRMIGGMKEIVKGDKKTFKHPEWMIYANQAGMRRELAEMDLPYVLKASSFWDKTKKDKTRKPKKKVENDLKPVYDSARDHLVIELQCFDGFRSGELSEDWRIAPGLGFSCIDVQGLEKVVKRRHLTVRDSGPGYFICQSPDGIPVKFVHRGSDIPSGVSSKQPNTEFVKGLATGRPSGPPKDYAPPTAEERAFMQGLFGSGRSQPPRAASPPDPPPPTFSAANFNPPSAQPNDMALIQGILGSGMGKPFASGSSKPSAAAAPQTNAWVPSGFSGAPSEEEIRRMKSQNEANTRRLMAQNEANTRRLMAQNEANTRRLMAQNEQHMKQFTQSSQKNDGGCAQQ